MRDTVVKEMSGGLSKDEFDAWKTILNSRSAGDIWKKINWKGEVKGEVKGMKIKGKGPPVDELAKQFESKSSAASNDVPVSYVQNNDTTYVDVLDKPIEMEEISIRM